MIIIIHFYHSTKSEHRKYYVNLSWQIDDDLEENLSVYRNVS